MNLDSPQRDFGAPRLATQVAELKTKLDQALAEIEDLKEAFAAEACIIEAQALSLSPRALGKNRREIILTQVQRMYGVALDRDMPRNFGRAWRDRATERWEVLVNR